MDRYLTLPVKRKSDDSDLENGSIEFGSPCKVAKRMFKDSWLSDPEFSSFLKYDASKKVMLCKLCIQCQYTNSFTTGCSIMKKESIMKHITCKDHKNAVQASKLRPQMVTAQTTSISKKTNAIKSAMANVYFLAKSDCPSSMIEQLNNFMLYQGVSQLADLKVDNHTTYLHHSSVADFQSCMSAVLEDDLSEKIKNSTKFSLMFDESTDISVHQNLIMYIRVLENDNFGNTEPHTYFLGIDSLERANSESIYAKVVGTLARKGIDVRGLCGISTDGASVMVGHKSGVVSRLKRDVPGVLATHCIAHRLALSCCSGADRIPYLVKVQEILNNVYKYFHNSPKNMAVLESVQKLTSGESTKFKEVFHTRWLSFEGSVDALIRNYSSLVSVFLEESSGKSLSLHKPITTYKFLYVVHYLADVLKPISVLSKSFQSADLDFSEVSPLLMSTINQIERISGKSGPRLSRFLKDVPQEPKVGDDGLYTFDFQGHTIRDSDKQRIEAKAVCSKFSEYMVASLNDRFSDNEDSAILSALSSLFRPDVEVVDKAKDIDVVEEYLFKLGHVGSKEEIEMFLGYVDTLVKTDNRSVRSARNVASLAIKKSDVYPTVSEAAGRFLVAPVSTVDCERGFSRQNLIKTCLRNRMSVEALDRLLRISIDGPDVEAFPYEKAMEKWANVKTRRILK